ncbi:hypothetical protein BC834DRAFT_898329 [Gloeopeniophorella convolvens]|nr:hypothetical protein BC834DRAFT_898329 [Gloeopeniophorella convolvens]
MSRSPVPPPPLPSSASSANPNNAHTSSPSQLAHILSTVLADNETLSKDLATARSRYERAEQTLALLKPSGASAAAADDSASPPLSTYPDSAVRAILDLRSRVDAEHTAREAAEARLRAISEAWVDLDRYLQTSEVHLSDARSHFSQLLRDTSNKLSLAPLPPYQPRRSHHSSTRAPVAAAQTFPTFPPPPAPAGLPPRVRHRDDSADDAPPPKRLRADRGARYPAEASRLHAPPSYSTPDMNHFHLAYPAQHPAARGRRLERQVHSPSLSLSPTRSRSSSMSLDELLLEATDDHRASPPSPPPSHTYPAPPPAYVRPASSLRRSRSPDYRPPHSIRTSSNAISPNLVPAQPQSQSQYQTLQTHIFAPPVTGPPGKRPKAGDVTPSVSAAPSARSLVGTTSLPAIPPGGYPATNDKGQRICRQCGLPGRYKDGKCVEKWGPGPDGPGTVCDRCRKKMKRVERRGTLDPHSQVPAFVHARVHAQAHVAERDHPHSHTHAGTGASQGSDRSIGRTDTVVVQHPPAGSHLRPYSSSARERDAVSPRSNASSLSAPQPKDESASSRSRTHSPPVPPPALHRNGAPPVKLARLLSSGESDAEGEAEAEEADDADADLLAAVDAAEASGGKPIAGPVPAAAWVKHEIEAV